MVEEHHSYLAAPHMKQDADSIDSNLDYDSDL